MISTDKSLLNLDLIHEFIANESYWGIGRSREVMAKAITHSAYCFGVYHLNNDWQRQIGFARVEIESLVKSGRKIPCLIYTL